MAKEIDEFLMDKFRNGVEKRGSPSKIAICDKYPLSNKSLYNHFREIKEIFGQSPPEDIEKIREKLYCINDLWTEFKVVSNKDQATRMNLRKTLTNMKAELKRDSVKPANRTASKQGDGDHDKPSSPTQTSVVMSNVYGFDDDVTSLEKVLVRPGSEDRFKAIGIMGKAGIGKTALSQLLFNKVKDYFLPRIWISMSALPVDEQGKKVAIVERMLESLGVKKEDIMNKVDEGQEHKLKGLLYALHLQLQGKRYLIVLDDASNTDKWYGQLNSTPTRVGEWDRLACGLPKGCGGAVIVTSRNEELAGKMVGGGEGEGFLHRVLPLSDPESFWKIFIQAAEQQESNRKYDISELQINKGILKEEILQKCAGLPLTVTMMGEYQDFLK